MLFDTLKMNYSSLEVIYLGDNKGIDDRCMKSLGEYIKSNNNIEIVWLENTNISDTGIEILAPYLNGNTRSKALNLMSNKGITDKSFPFLMKMIESSCIEHITIDSISIAQQSIIYVLSAFNTIKYGSTSLDLNAR